MHCRARAAAIPRARRVTVPWAHRPAYAGSEASPAVHRHLGAFIALAVASAFCVLDWAIHPYGPDLSAQIARAGAATRGVTMWWDGWYGGTNIATYSTLSGPLMQHLGVAGAGVLACLAIAVLAADLLRNSLRPRAGAAGVAAAAAADLFSGRVTFALGMVAALAALCLLRRGRPVVAVVAATMSGLISPLAALFLIEAVIAVAVTDPGRRRVALVACAGGALPVVASAAVFGQPSVMPFGADVLVPTLIACGALVVARVPKTVRTAALLSGGVACAAFILPSAIGSTASRIPMLASAPVLLATARGPRRIIATASIGLALWPAINLVTDLRPSSDPSIAAQYYEPLLAHLPVTGLATQRLEVVDPKSHGADAWLPPRVPLARGWQRADDFAANALFYAPTLSATDYLDWLRQRGVGWVALPDSPLDYGAVTEGRLVTAGLPYLREVWRGAHWRLFRVTSPAPMVVGVADVIGMTDTSVQLRASRGGTAVAHLAYSRLLTLRDAAGVESGCVSPISSGADTLLSFPTAGSYRLQGDLDAALATPHSACPVAGRN